MIAFFNSFHVGVNEANTPVEPQSASEALINKVPKVLQESDKGVRVGFQKKEQHEFVD